LRKKKETPKVSSPSEELTIEQVYDVLKFANAAYNNYQGIYTPDLVNSVMKGITLNTQEANLDNITKALQDPKNNEQKLIGYSEFMELNSMLYRRILLYFSGLMSFDWTYTSTNVIDSKEYSSPAYKRDLATVRDFFDRFNVKQEFRVAMKQMLRQEAFYAVFRDDGEKYILQELPQYYSKITGRWDFGLTYDFNFVFFLQPGTNLDMYPRIFKKLYNKAFEGKNVNQYDPALSINNRDSSFVYWVQTSPKDGFTAFKLFPEIASVIPMLAPLLGDAVLQPVVRSLQQNSYIQQASKLVFGQVEFLKDTSSKVKDSLSLDPVTLGKFLALLKAGIPDAIKVGAAPLANTAAIEFSGDNTMYDSYLKSTASVSGVNSRLIYSFDRQNVLETKLSMDIDQNILKPVYSQFSNMLEYWVNQRTKKYKFKFEFEGFNTSIDRAERLDTVTRLADSGIVMEQKFASAIGMNPFDFRRQLEETKANGFVKSLTPILKSNQMPGNAGAGAPKKADGNLSDGGSDTRSAGSDEEKSQE
jgi:hypothetical protein